MLLVLVLVNLNYTTIPKLYITISYQSVSGIL